MRRFQTGCIVFAGLWASTAWSQTTTTEGYNRNAWQYCWALQFAVRNATLGTFDGASISVRRHFGPGSALRLGFTIGDFAFSEMSTDYPAQDRKVEENYQSAGVDAEYVGYIGPKTNVTPLLLVGSSFNIVRSEVENVSYYKMWGTDVNLGLGVEWFFHHRISVSGEYVGSLFYTRETEDYDYGYQEVHRIRETVGIGHSRVRMGIAVSL